MPCTRFLFFTLTSECVPQKSTAANFQTMHTQQNRSHDGSTTTTAAAAVAKKKHTYEKNEKFFWSTIELGRLLHLKPCVCV